MTMRPSERGECLLLAESGRSEGSCGTDQIEDYGFSSVTDKDAGVRVFHRVARKPYEIRWCKRSPRPN